MCAIDEWEPWAVVRRHWHTARKQHQCCECQRVIAPGERCEVTTGRLACNTWWETWGVCRHCRAAADWLEVMRGGYPLGNLYGYLREHWYDGCRSPVLGRLTAGVKLGWLDGRMPVPELAAEDARRQLGEVVA